MATLQIRLKKQYMYTCEMDTGPRNCGIDSFIMFDGFFW